MSHELRTPLNAIGGYTELLELGVRGPITDDQRRDLERIRLSQQHLLNLIGGVLDLARIENGRVAYHLSTVDVGKLFDELEALVTPQANAKRHDLVIEDVEPGLAVEADAEKLRQILLNLASNAIRHTPVGTRITVSARATTDRVVEISVRDTGPGVPADRHEEVFEPFVQLDRSLTNSANGVGLGLAISRDLARGMGGDLTLVTNGAGACFAVTLPRATA
jgi:signal transduction histidine kinase